MNRAANVLLTAPPPAAGRTHEDASVERRVPRARTRTIIIVTAGVGCLLAVALVAGTIRRIANSHALAATAQQAGAPPTVDVIRSKPAAEAGLSIAGTTQAIADTIIYARTSGYLGKRYVDIGDNVKAGQLLAEIESPEIDQQLIQARAQLQQSIKNLELQQASLDIAKVTMDRYKAADQEGAVAKELVDQQTAGWRTAQAAVAAAQAAIDSNKANVDRFQQLTSFERVLAPFDGTITQRNVDVGALITAGSPTNNTAVAPGGTTGTPSGLFQVSQLDTLRVFVNVPQSYAANVRAGLAAQISARGRLASPITGKVARTANALDPATRTLLTEVDLPNPSHALYPGMWVYVDFQIAPAGTRFRVPATAVVANAQGTQVVVIADGSTIHYQPVVVGRDFGDAVDIQAGLNGNELIVKQPTVALQEGQHVTPGESKIGAK